MSKKDMKKVTEEVMNKFSKTFENLAEVEKADKIIEPSYTEKCQDLFYDAAGQLRIVDLEYDPETQAVRIVSIKEGQYGVPAQVEIHRIQKQLAQKVLIDAKRKK